MLIRIKETQELKDLTITNENGIEWTEDLIAASEFYNDETEEYEMSQGDFNWWQEYIGNYLQDEEDTKELAEELEIDVQEIRDRISESLYCDMEDEHDTKQQILQEIRDKNKL